MVMIIRIDDNDDDDEKVQLSRTAKTMVELYRNAPPRQPSLPMHPPYPSESIPTHIQLAAPSTQRPAQIFPINASPPTLFVLPSHIIPTTSLRRSSPPCSLLRPISPARNLRRSLCLAACGGHAGTRSSAWRCVCSPLGIGKGSIFFFASGFGVSQRQRQNAGERGGEKIARLAGRRT